MIKKWSIMKGLSKNRFVLFFVFLGLSVLFSVTLHEGKILPSAETKNLWFYSGLLMLVFSILFIEPYYTSPKNVLTNATPLLLLLLATKSEFSMQIFWWFALVFLMFVVLVSIISISIDDKNKSPSHWMNRVSKILKRMVVSLGRGKILYSCFFFYFLLTYHPMQDTYILVLLAFWAGILLIDPKSLNNTFSIWKKEDFENAIGEIFGVQSKKIFLAKLFQDQNNVRQHEIVKFQYSMHSNNLISKGIVLDTYLLNQEKWIKVLHLEDGEKSEGYLNDNTIYKIHPENSESIENFTIQDFVGVVSEGSDIGKIRFEYSRERGDIEEGSLLELQAGGKKIYYQIVNAITEKEVLEGKDERGFVRGVAIQIGEWQDQDLSFQKFAWVPSINTPVFKADTSSMDVSTVSYPEYEIGVIPGTELPLVVNLNELVSHHTAILGITGSGKSFLARGIIKQIQNTTKIICFDFNEEFVKEVKPTPIDIIGDKEGEITIKIGSLNKELAEYENKQKREKIKEWDREINNVLRCKIQSFLDSEDKVGICKLPDADNSAIVFDYMKHFFRMLFQIAKERKDGANQVKICILLEEAHTIIPEWNFSGSNDKRSGNLVNSIGQVALQGRKYGVGFLVITQRTANVSKTVLTQCNTVISFQTFDETSFKFLVNYLGEDLIQALPNLKQYHAIVAGKAAKSNIPMIVDLTKNEPLSEFKAPRK